jgi:hypothetical protein
MVPFGCRVCLPSGVFTGATCLAAVKFLPLRSPPSFPSSWPRCVQVKYFFGVDVPRKDAVQEQLKTLFDAIHDFKWREYVMGVSLLLLLILLKRASTYSKRLVWLRAIGPLCVCVFGISLVAGGNIDQYGEIETIMDIPAGGSCRCPAPYMVPAGFVASHC